MIKKKILTLSLVLVMSLTSVLSSLSVSSAHLSQSSVIASGRPESHLIEGIPYVSQETSFDCAYASFTMLLNSFEDINATLQDVFYYMGVGYSLLYPNIRFKRIPGGGAHISQQFEDIAFLTGLYGLSYEYWEAPASLSDNDCWDSYWIRVKQNISNGTPVISGVNAYSLSSLNKIFSFSVFDWILNKLPPSGHAVVIVGYNESNGTVCYHDPQMGYICYPEYGTYTWMNITEFRQAVEDMKDETGYGILTFKRVTNPLSKEEAYNRSHERNIEKLKGNLSAYDENFIDLYDISDLGINASKLFREQLGRGVNNRIKTSITYKIQGKTGILYRLMKRFLPHLAILINLPPYTFEKFYQNPFETIAIQRKYMARYLLNNIDINNSCAYEAMLFEREAENWEKLASCYSVFMKKGIFLSFPRAIFIVNRMNKIMDKIITIEEAIIQGSGS